MVEEALHWFIRLQMKCVQLVRSSKGQINKSIFHYLEDSVIHIYYCPFDVIASGSDNSTVKRRVRWYQRELAAKGAPYFLRSMCSPLHNNKFTDGTGDLCDFGATRLQGMFVFPTSMKTVQSSSATNTMLKHPRTHYRMVGAIPAQQYRQRVSWNVA